MMSSMHFPGILDISIMNGGREVHIKVDHKKVSDSDLKNLIGDIKKNIQEEVAFPGQIKIQVNRIFESVSVA